MKETDPCAHLARMIATYGRAKRVRLAMLWAYFDETAVNVVGIDGKRRPTEMLVGGCIADSARWEIFNKKWHQALDRQGVTEFHAKDFYTFNREFSWFKGGKRDWARHNRFRDRLADLILEFADELVAFTSQISIGKKGVKQSYEDAALRAMYDCTKDRATRDNSLYVVLARHPELKPWSVLKHFENMDWEKKLGGCGVFSPKDVLPLQAADFVLNTINKRWDGIETPAFERLRDGCKLRGKQFALQLGSSFDPQALLAARRA